jgi:DHA2 family multidrug resistance protein
VSYVTSPLLARSYNHGLDFVMSPSENRHVNPRIVTAAVMLATFMETPRHHGGQPFGAHLADNLGTTVEEGTWVVTSYLVSNAIILPVSGSLANRIGRRNMLLACFSAFTFTSLSCGMATSLDWLIFFGVLQGLAGGALQSLAQTRLARDLPAEAAWHRHGCLRTRHPPRSQATSICA